MCTFHRVVPSRRLSSTATGASLSYLSVEVLHAYEKFPLALVRVRFNPVEAAVAEHLWVLKCIVEGGIGATKMTNGQLVR